MRCLPQQRLLTVVAIAICTLLPLATAKCGSTVFAISQPVENGSISSIYSTPDINDYGQVAFPAGLRNVGLSLLLGDGQANIQLITNGDPAPDGNGQFFGHADDPVINSAGQVVFRGSVRQTSGGFTDTLGIFVASESGVLQIAREGGRTPDQAFVFDNFHYPLLNNNGQVAFQALLRNSNFKYGIYRSNGTTLQEVARFDQMRPDGMGTFDLLGGLAINGPGDVAFLSNDITGSNEGPYAHLYLDTGETLTEIARQCQTAPGIAKSFHSFPFQSFALNDAGELVFQANVLTNGAAPTQQGIYLWREGAIVPIVREGDSIPNGTGAFSQIDMIRPTLNSLGETVFWAEFTDNTVEFTGLFVSSTDGLVEVARSGQPAPDQTGMIGPFFSGLTEINEAGQFAFTAASVWSSPDSAAYVYDGNDLTTIARLGQPLAGSTLESIESLCSCDSMNINAEGQVVIQFQLADDRTGILFFTPEGPTTTGDFNEDGNVDAADYVMWRKTDGTQEAYYTWRANFGEPTGSGSDASTTVPEPATALLIMIAAVGGCLRRVRAA